MRKILFIIGIFVMFLTLASFYTSTPTPVSSYSKNDTLIQKLNNMLWGVTEGNKLSDFFASETNDFITYDTVLAARPASHRFVLRITRPRNMFTTGHPDSARRSAFIFIPGAGEMSFGDAGVNDTTAMKAKLAVYGPHYWLNNGWTGKVTTGNGDHYPIFITIMCNKIPNVGDNYLGWVMSNIINTYHIKRNSIHVVGPSAGGWVWGRYITYSTANMNIVKSFVALQGAGLCPDDGTSACSGTGLGISGWGTWAQTYGGKFMGIEGTADTRNLWQVRNAMDATTTGQAYFTYENYGGGAHCCFNTFTDPSITDWQCTGTITNPNIQTNGLSGRHNSMGTYKKGDNVFTWMFKQGDTALVSGATLPTASAGADQTINLPTSSTTLNGTGSTNYTSAAWTLISGPNVPGIQNPNTATATIGATGNPLIIGTYVYRITVEDGDGNTATDDINIIVDDPANIPPVADAGADRTITLPKDTIHAAGAVSDVDGSATGVWTQQSGPSTATIVSPTSMTTTISDLVEGTYIFRLTATDNEGATSYDEMAVTVFGATGAPKMVNVNIYSTVPYVNSEWNNWNPNSNLVNPLYTNGEISPFTLSLSIPGTIGNNGTSYTGNTIVPNEVHQYYTSITVSRTLTISGLDNSKEYNIIVYSSRLDVAPLSNFETKFSIGAATRTVVTSNNKTTAAVFNNFSPTGGSIVITSVRGDSAGVNSNVINGITIQEVGSDGFNVAPIVTTLPVSPQAPNVQANLWATIQDEDTSSVTYQWLQSSGPVTASITSPTVRNTTVTGMTLPGIYVFQLVATDSLGLIGTGTITIVVNSSGNTLPVANAGTDQSITLPISATTLLGTDSDADGTVVTRLWTRISGPVQFTLNNANIAQPVFSNLVAGTYQMEYRVTDNNGGQDADTVQITVNSSFTSPGKLFGPGEYVGGYIHSNGLAYQWGNVSGGEVGRPVRLVTSPVDLRFIYVASGLNGTAFIDENKYAWIAGYNENGEHGVGDSILRNNPSRISFDSIGNDFGNIKSITAYHYRATSPTEDITGWLAVKEDGTLWNWGNVQYGYSGTGALMQANRPRPVQIVMPGNRQVAKVAAAIAVIILCTDGTVWTYGGGSSAANLGRSITGTDYSRPVQVTGLANIIEIAGGRTWNWAYSSTGTLYKWGSWGEYMGVTSGTSVPTPVAAPTVTNVLPAPIQKIVTSHFSTHFLLTDGSLWGMGGSPMGNVGNGVLIDPLGGTDLFSRGAAMVTLPVRIAPNLQFKDVNTNGCYTMYITAVDVNDSAYVTGRFKGGVLPLGARFATTQVGSTYGNDFDYGWLTPVSVIVAAQQPSIFLVQARTCIADPGAPNCNTPPASTAPTANAGPNQNITTNNTALNGTSSSDAIKVLKQTWSQISGPSAAQINLPGSLTPRVYFSTDGTFVFKLVVENGGRKKDSSTVTINVAQTGNAPPTLLALENKTITLPVSSTTITAQAIDADGTITGYLWSKVSGPTGGNISSTTAQTPTITALQAQSSTTAGTYVYQVVATDNGGLTVTGLVTITVNPAPSAPTPPLLLPPIHRFKVRR